MMPLWSYEKALAGSSCGVCPIMIGPEASPDVVLRPTLSPWACYSPVQQTKYTSVLHTLLGLGYFATVNV